MHHCAPSSCCPSCHENALWACAFQVSALSASQSLSQTLCLWSARYGSEGTEVVGAVLPLHTEHRSCSCIPGGLDRGSVPAYTLHIHRWHTRSSRSSSARLALVQQESSSLAARARGRRSTSIVACRHSGSESESEMVRAGTSLQRVQPP